MAKQNRYQSIISKQSDSDQSDDHWLKQFEKTLQKVSVRPKGENIYDQITSIMNGSKPKYSSVQAAVDDMMHRSGLSGYLDNVKISEFDQTKKTAQHDEDHKDKKDEEHEDKKDDKMPDVIKQKSSILNTLENIINDSRGNKPIPTIISHLHSLHANDISDDSAWEDEKLIRLVSRLNLEAKKNNPSNYENYSALGKSDSSANVEADPSNYDAFISLMPNKF